MSKEDFGHRYQALFEYLTKEHGLTLVESEMQEIVRLSCASKWTRLTDSISSLPPKNKWILLAHSGEGGVVVEAIYGGSSMHGHSFCLRGGKMLVDGKFDGRNIAWKAMDTYGVDE